MKKIYLFLFMTLMLGGMVSSYDEQISNICGGDDQTIIGCPIGEEQSFNFFQFVKEKVGGSIVDTYGVLDTSILGGRLPDLPPLASTIILISLISLLVILIVALLYREYRKKKKISNILS